jgi:tryptophan synthase alpha chain
MGALETSLRSVKDAGERAFVPYVTGGFPGVDAALIRSLHEAGADAIEIGIPFSDPVMDGGVIQEASRRSLEAGTTPRDVLAVIAEAAVSTPVAVMTYVNPVVRIGVAGFLDLARDAGVSAVIVPDLPVDEADELGFGDEAQARGIDAVLLAAPGSAPERLEAIARRARGFIYCVATYGVTGARERLSDAARPVVEALRPRTDLPLLAGVGIATPELASEACTFADGVIVGSALMTLMVEGRTDRMLELAEAFHRATRHSEGVRDGLRDRR